MPWYVFRIGPNDIVERFPLDDYFFLCTSTLSNPRVPQPTNHSFPQIHDVQHPGVPNSQLVKEGVELASMYNNRSLAELNSLDLAWGVLMKDDYKDLRATIYSTETEFHHFRQLMVNIVLATDIMDKDIGALRKDRWSKAFASSSSSSSLSSSSSSSLNLSTKCSRRDDVNRKATIVIEHLIQASDVAHTMQHWSVYLKWNERFFDECYAAYKAGRATKDPSEGWYQGELGFFDFYIIPLAKKLKDCGVFGVSSAEYLRYAEQNRQEWESRGRDVVADYVRKNTMVEQGKGDCTVIPLKG